MSETQSEPSAPMILDEFCRRLSETEPSVELIAVFEYLERQSGRHHDAEAAYRARFSAVGSRLAD